MSIDIHRALAELYRNGAGYMQEGNHYSGLKWLDSRPKPTELEIEAKIAELQAAEPMRLLREQRNQLLAQTDWMAVADRTMTQAQIDYRQSLRDLPETANPQLDENGQLTNVTWPTYE